MPPNVEKGKKKIRLNPLETNGRLHEAPVGHPFSKDTWPHRRAKASSFRHDFPVHWNCSAPWRGEGRDRRWERRRVLRERAWRRTAPSISQCQEFHTTD